MAFVHHKEPGTKKWALNLSLDSAWTDGARSLGIHRRQFLETPLHKALRSHRERAWRAHNREAIRRCNASVAEQGGFGERFRRF